MEAHPFLTSYGIEISAVQDDDTNEQEQSWLDLLDELLEPIEIPLDTSSKRKDDPISSKHNLRPEVHKVPLLGSSGSLTKFSASLDVPLSLCNASRIGSDTYGETTPSVYFYPTAAATQNGDDDELHDGGKNTDFFMPQYDDTDKFDVPSYHELPVENFRSPRQNDIWEVTREPTKSYPNYFDYFYNVDAHLPDSPEDTDFADLAHPVDEVSTIPFSLHDALLATYATGDNAYDAHDDYSNKVHTRSSSTTETTIDSDAHGGVVGTTLMLRNLPNKYTREMLINELEQRGVMKDIDFLYLPIDMRQYRNVGYCFLNLVSEDAVRRFKATFEGTKMMFVRSSKVLEVSEGGIQGLAANIQHYRNRAIVNLPAKYQPMVFKDGNPYPFPKPTMSKFEMRKLKPEKKGVSSRLVTGKPPNRNRV